MVKSSITIKKFIKMYLEVKFYYFLFYVIFLVTGYEAFSLNGLIRTVFNVVYEAGSLYTGTYILFFLFIPFLNVLIKAMNKKQHQALLVLFISYFTVFSTVFNHDTFDFIGWMITMYLIGGYIRLYKNYLFESTNYAAIGLIISNLLMVISILAIDFIGPKFGFTVYYHMVADSHKLLALTCSVFAFLLFKNLKIKQSRIINTIAASTFGILLIHTNSNTMRRFLWQDLFNNTSFYNSHWLVIQAIGAVIGTYIACLALDQLRIRFIEKPIIKRIERTHWLKRVSNL